MIVFKFGGASVKSAGAVRNVADILKSFKGKKIVVVVSAMGKSTNALERIIEHFTRQHTKEMEAEFNGLREYHNGIARELFPDPDHPFHSELSAVFEDLRAKLDDEPARNYDFVYDQIICFGEILSTKIISAFLNETGLKNDWMDIRKYLKSNDTFREARIEWELSSDLIKKAFQFRSTGLYITQGFIASTPDNRVTSLGREGSDFTAAILAHILKAENVTIWKDVPGVLNADPKWFDDTIKLDNISYLDAIELAYYGAGVIHPKTIKPLQNKNIDLYVKSFVNPEKEGTLVSNLSYDSLVPSFIFKMDQVLIRISPRDFSFIAEDNLELIFGLIHKYGVKINLMQNSAVSFQICINNDRRKLMELIEDLERDFRLSYETGLELITIRYFDQSTIDRVMINKELLLEQRYRQNIQLIVRDKG